MKKRLAIVTTHPIQYNAPIFALLQSNGLIEVKVFYTWGESVLKKKFDPGFQKEILWDIPLLDGYVYEFVKNVSAKPGSDHFFGIRNPTLNQDIEKWGADAILIFGWNFQSHLNCLRHFKRKIPLFFRGDSTLLIKSKNPIKRIIRSKFLSWVYGHIDLAFYVGQANKEYFLKHGLTESKLVFAPHAIDNKRFEHAQKSDFRDKLSIPKKSVLFLFTGKFEEVKNLNLLLKAFKSLNTEAFLLLVGNGKLEVALKEQVSEFPDDVKFRIKFHDFVNQKEIPEVYQNADIFVLPSKSETWGLSVNEAMAAGKAVIVTDTCGCHRDIIEEGKNGHIVPVDDEQSLVNAMNSCLKGNRYIEMGVQSRKIIANFNFEKIATAIQNQL